MWGEDEEEKKAKMKIGFMVSVKLFWVTGKVKLILETIDLSALHVITYKLKGKLLIYQDYRLNFM